MSNKYRKREFSNYPNICKLARKLSFLASFLFLGLHLHAQECDEMVCNGNLQISLGIECELVVTPDMVLESPAGQGNYDIVFFETDGSAIGDTLTSQQAGKTLTYQVSCSGNSCWGQATIETNIIPEIEAPCACTETGIIPEECNFWCSADVSTPEIIFSVEEATALFGECGPDLIGNIIVEETREGDLCSSSGETITISYKAKVSFHGRIEEIELLCQSYTIEKLDIEDDDFFEEHFSFPVDVNLSCSVFTNTTPRSLSSMGIASAYPYYIDVHNPILNTSLECDRVQIEVVIGSHEEMVEQVIDGDTVWTLVTVVDKITRDSTFNCTFEPVLDINGNQVTTNRLVPIDEAVCNIISSFSDIEFAACGNSRKIFRNWNLIDWCDNSITRTERQVIEVTDITPPSFFPINDQFVSIEPWSCSAKVRLPFPFVNDGCGGIVTREFESLEGRIEEGFLLDLWIDQSPINVTFVATDECGNSATDDFRIVVRDDVNPVAICEVELQVHLTSGIDGGEATAKIYAESFDEGSHDAGCGDVTLQVVRMEDWMEQVLDCEGEFLGYKAMSCNAQFTSVDAGLIEDFKGDSCVYNGNNIVDISELGDFVKFCCDDAERDDLFVILIATDAAGNTNQCMIKVDVINVGTPTLICQDVEIDCDEFLDEAPGPEVIGGNCSNSDYNIILADESDLSGSCGNGVITREWFVDLDGDGELGPLDLFCEQFISISNASSKFDPYTLKWPKHYNNLSVQGINLECDPLGGVIETVQNVDLGDAMNCMPDSDSGQKPSWCDTNCGLVGYSMDQDTIHSGGDACLKIIKRWTVIDWCLYESNGEGIDDENDTDEDQFEAVEDWAQGVCADCDNGNGPIHDDSVYLRYTDVDEDGYYTYDQIIKVFDETKPIINIEEPTVYVDIINGALSKDDDTPCTGTATISASASDFCDVFEVDGSSLTWEITVTNGSGEPVYDTNVIDTYYDSGPTATITTGAGVSGEIYTVEWIVSDACGNSEWAATTVIFRDAKPPTPFCISGLTTAYTDVDGNVTVWGKEFDFGSFDNCCPAEDLRFTVVRAGETPIQPGEAGFSDQAGITFYCEDIANYSQLDVWVWDCDGNGDFCRVNILVSGECGGSDNGDGSGSMIAGQISTEVGDQVEDAAVRIVSSLPEYPNTMQTTNDGNYAFANNPLTYNYTVQAAKDGDDSNGVSTLDLVLIQRHIIGNELLNSPYKIIAADVSNDERISSLDLFEIKKLILGISDSFDDTESWVFVDANQQFVDIENPWPIEESKYILSLSEDQMNEDFIGIKKGDVNNNAAANQFSKIETRSNATLNFTVFEEHTNDQGQIEIPIYSDNFDDIHGFQMTLDHQGYNLVGIASHALQVEEHDFVQIDGRTHLIWFDGSMKSVDKQDVLFSLQFEERQNVEGYDILHALQLIDSRFKLEAYVGIEKQVHNLNLVVAGKDDLPILHQNTPNPFADQSEISFYLPTEGIVDFRIENATGQTIMAKTEFLQGGNQTILLGKDVLPVSGIYYYTMKFQNMISTRKMVFIKS